MVYRLTEQVGFLPMPPIWEHGEEGDTSGTSALCHCLPWGLSRGEAGVASSLFSPQTL